MLLARSLLIGVASHILWDSFTHEGRMGLAAAPILDESWGPLPGYTWIQHGSSVLGLVVLAWWALRWLRRQTPTSSPRVVPSAVRVAWWVSLPAVLLLAWAAGFAVHGPLTGTFTAAHLAYRVLPPACAVWGALTLSLCVLVQVRRRRLRR